MTITADTLTIIVSICTGIAGLIAGIATGTWWVSAKSAKIDQHQIAIDQINARCDAQRSQMLVDLEKAICSGIKSALKDMENKWLERNAAMQITVARIEATVEQHDADIRLIFERMEKK